MEMTKVGTPNRKISSSVDSNDDTLGPRFVHRTTRSCTGWKTTARIMANANGFRKGYVMTNANARTIRVRASRNTIVARLVFIGESVQVVTRTFHAGQQRCPDAALIPQAGTSPRYNSVSSKLNQGFRKGGHASLVQDVHSHAARGPSRRRGRQPQVSCPRRIHPAARRGPVLLPLPRPALDAQDNQYRP